MEPKLSSVLSASPWQIPALATQYDHNYLTDLKAEGDLIPNCRTTASEFLRQVGL